MAFLDLVKQRYSCRSYQEKSVEQEKLDYVGGEQATMDVPHSKERAR